MGGLIQGYESPDHPADLIAVADAGANLEGGETALRLEVLKLAKFNEAEPNYGHRATAELLCEGGISLMLLWNWDTCIERVDVSPERLQVSLSHSDLKNLAEPSIAKVHGCATRRDTLLITSKDLDEPPVWADDATRDHLRGKTVVFIGVGDIADYAKRRLEQLRGELEESDGDEDDMDIWVVSPGIKSGWDDSAWAELLPNLPEEKRLAMSADQFLDELARRWVREALDDLKVATAEAKQEVREAAESLDLSLSSAGSVEALRWGRRAAMGQAIGGSVMFDDSLKQLLLGYAVSASEAANRSVRLKGPAAFEIGGERVEALINCQAGPAGRVRERARARARVLADQGVIEDQACFMVAGTVIGALDDDPDPQLDMAIGEQSADHLVVGPSAVKLSFRRASALEAAA